MKHTLKRLWKHYGLSITLILLFLATLVGQALTGREEYNEDRIERGLPILSLRGYLCSAHFLEATAENWESEFLQMGAFVWFTIFLFQKGSAESKAPDESAPQDEDPRQHRHDPKAPWPVRKGGVVLWLYERSLGLTFLLLFLFSTAMHAWGGVRIFNEKQTAHGEETITFWNYFTTSRFWFEAFQNWQSEFLSIACMVIFTVFLRHRGSPESKPVATPHGENE